MRSLSALLRRAELALTGPLPESVRAAARIELVGAMLYGAFFAGSLGFLPVVLRRLGATTDQLALYVTFTYVGQLLSPLSITLMRRRAPLRFATACWVAARGSLVLAAVIADATWLLALVGVFWVVEMLPAPAYARVMEQIYPLRYRGRAMAGVRVGMTLVVLVATPLAGALLDQVGPRVLLPAAAVFGVLAALVFARVNVEGAEKPVSAERAAPAEPAPTASVATAPSDSRSAPSPLSAISALWRNRPFGLYLAGLTVYGFGGVMALPLYPVVQVSRLGLSYTQIGYLGLAQSLMWLVGFLYWGRLLDRRGPVWVLRLSMGLAALVPLTYVFAGSAWALLPAFLVQGLIQGGFELGVTNTGIALAERGRVMEYTALQTAVVGLRGMLAPFLGTLLLALGAPDTAVFALSVALIAGGWILLGRVRA
ncbi:MAG TPA: MFS transporter [Roseiflexaceae bacterium]|nr:MFS transporter [Roseiflexaceae bacterium]